MIVVLGLIVVAFSLVNGQEICIDSVGFNITTCTECIWQVDCVWCPDIDQSSSLAVGCIRKGTYDCKNEPIESEAPIKIDFINRPLSDSIQISPQNVQLKVSPDQEATLRFKVALSDNPVDVYLLIDASYSMQDHIKRLRSTTASIGRRLQKLTKDYMIGYGTFIEKCIGPFAKPEKIYQKYNQRAPYNFRHDLTLTQNLTLLSSRLDATENGLAKNLDSPEAGLDALMQAATCGKYIGWRDGVRKMIVYISDNPLHYAMDGKWAGIFTPNDRQCHLSRPPGGSYYEYDEELTMDYPSFDQVRHELRKMDIVVVFAVTPFMSALYQKVSLKFNNADYVRNLTRDTSSIENTITQQYEKIKSRLKVRASIKTGNAAISLKSLCDNPMFDTEDAMTSTCTGKELFSQGF